MNFLHDVLTLLHFVGFAALFGGFFTQLKTSTPVVNNAMLHGALTQLVTGVLLVGLASGIKDDDFTVDNAKIAVKLVVVLVVTALIWVNRKKPAIPRGLLMGIGGLTLLNTVVAVFWH
jgi:cytochrome bd-type quinol oxidase subunit 2